MLTTTLLLLLLLLCCCWWWRLLCRMISPSTFQVSPAAATPL
jgi:hypothetical protein